MGCEIMSSCIVDVRTDTLLNLPKAGLLFLSSKGFFRDHLFPERRESDHDQIFIRLFDIAVPS